MKILRLRLSLLILALTIVLMVGAAPLSAQTSEELIYIFPESEMALNSYESFFVDQGVPLIQLEYHPTETIFSTPTETLDEPENEERDSGDASEFLNPSEIYSFVFNEEVVGLAFELEGYFEDFIETPDPLHFTLELPDGQTQIYYDLSSFKLLNPPSGEYRFKLDAEALNDYRLTVNTLSLELPSEESGYFLVSPEDSFSDSDLETIVDFFQSGGNVAVISNRDVATALGVYLSYYDYTFEGSPMDDIVGLSALSRSTLSVIDSHEAYLDECAQFEDIKVDDQPILKRFFCPQPDNSLQTLLILDQHLFNLNEADYLYTSRFNFDLEDSHLYGDLIQMIQLPSRFALDVMSEATITPTQQMDIPSKLSTRWFVLLIFATLFIILFASPRLLAGSRSIGSVCSYWQKFYKQFNWTPHLTPTQRQYILMLFVLAAVLFLYAFFFVGRFAGWLLGIAAILGVLIYFDLRDRTGLEFVIPPSMKWFLKISLGLVAALPIVFVLHSILSPLLTIDRSSEVIPFSNLQTTDHDLWHIPGDYLMMVNDSLNIHLEDLHAPVKDLILGATLKSNATIRLNHSGSSSPFFVSPLTEFSLVKGLGDLELYRRRSSPILNTQEAVHSDDWESFLREHLPDGSYLGYWFDSYDWDSSVFLIDELAAASADFQEAYTHLTLHESVKFYTYLTDGLDLTLTFPSTHRIEGRLIVQNASGDVVHQEAIDDALESDESLTLSIDVPDLVPGLYTFQFSWDTESIPSLRHLKLNSTHLVFQTDYLESQGDAVLYFKNFPENFLQQASIYPQYLLHDLGENLKDPDGNPVEDLADMIVTQDGLYKIYLPPFLNRIESSRSVLYSFSESSWFNPSYFYWDDGIESSNDYALIERYSSTVQLEEDWFRVEYSPPDASQNTVPYFQLELERVFDKPAWLVIKDLYFNSS